MLQGGTSRQSELPSVPRVGVGDGSIRMHQLLAQVATPPRTGIEPFRQVSDGAVLDGLESGPVRHLSETVGRDMSVVGVPFEIRAALPRGLKEPGTVELN
jgi:hypothetical protein